MTTPRNNVMKSRAKKQQEAEATLARIWHVSCFAPRMNAYSFWIERVLPRAGGGWRLQLLQNGVEVDCRVFPASHGDKRAAKRVYVEALRAAQAWIATHAHRK